MKIKITSLVIFVGIVLSMMMFTADFVSVVEAGVTETPTPTITGTPTATLIPTNTLVPTAVNTVVPVATNTPIPTPIPLNTITPAPTNTNTPTPTNTPSATNTPSNTATPTSTPQPNSGGGGGGATSTPSTTLNRESRASVPEDATTVPALGNGYSIPFLIVLNVILLVVLIGLVCAWRAVMQVLRR